MNSYFEANVEIPRIKIGKKQKLEKLIDEEAMLLASFIRDKKIWEPRTIPLTSFVIPRIFGVKRGAQPAFHPFFSMRH